MPKAQTGTPFGQMLYDPSDIWIGRSLRIYGEFSQAECDLFLEPSVIPDGGVVVEAGANIGCHTLAFAHFVGPQGHVHAFEPARLTFQTLCANLALNDIPNVTAYPVGLSDHTGKMSLASAEGAINHGGAHLVENSHGLNLSGTEGYEYVSLTTLDSLHLPRVDFIKADVEGHEASVIYGARDTIKRCSPILYVENDREDKSATLIDLIRQLDYDLWWHRPPLFNPDNFNGNPANVFLIPTDNPLEFGQYVSINMLCAPKEREFQTVIDGWEDAACYERIS